MTEHVGGIGGAEPFSLRDLVVHDAGERRDVGDDPGPEHRHDHGERRRALDGEVSARGPLEAFTDRRLQLRRCLRIGRANAATARELGELGGRDVLALAGERGVHVLERAKLGRRAGPLDELGEREGVLHFARCLVRIRAGAGVAAPRGARDEVQLRAREPHHRSEVPLEAVLGRGTRRAHVVPARRHLREVDHARPTEQRHLFELPVVDRRRGDEIEDRCLVAVAEGGELPRLRVVIVRSRRGERGGDAEIRVEIGPRVGVHRRGGGDEPAPKLDDQGLQRRDEALPLDALERELRAPEDGVQDRVDTDEERELLLEDVVKCVRVVVIREPIEDDEAIALQRLELLAREVEVRVDAVEVPGGMRAVPARSPCERLRCGSGTWRPTAALALRARDVVVGDEARRLGIRRLVDGIAEVVGLLAVGVEVGEGLGARPSRRPGGDGARADLVAGEGRAGVRCGARARARVERARRQGRSRIRRHLRRRRPRATSALRVGAAKHEQREEDEARGGERAMDPAHIGSVGHGHRSVTTLSLLWRKRDGSSHHLQLANGMQVTASFPFDLTQQA